MVKKVSSPTTAREHPARQHQESLVGDADADDDNRGQRHAHHLKAIKHIVGQLLVDIGMILAVRKKVESLLEIKAMAKQNTQLKPKGTIPSHSIYMKALAL